MPLDHEEPDGPAINIALFRVPPLLPRVGTILINPGGPESSGVEFARDSANMSPDEFDVAAPNTTSAYHHPSRSST